MNVLFDLMRYPQLEFIGSESSLIPASIYGEPQSLRLSHPLLFARLSTSNAEIQKINPISFIDQCVGSVDEDSLRIDPGLFAGMAKDIKVMLRQLKVLEYVYPTQMACPSRLLRYSKASNRGLANLIRLWAYHHKNHMHRNQVGVDIDFQIFKSGPSEADAPIPQVEDTYYKHLDIVPIVQQSTRKQGAEHRPIISQILSTPHSATSYFSVNIPAFQVSVRRQPSSIYQYIIISICTTYIFSLFLNT